jgi:hypothetical protein
MNKLYIDWGLTQKIKLTLDSYESKNVKQNKINTQ